MKNKQPPLLPALVLIVLIALAAFALYSLLTVRPVAGSQSLKEISLPPGFSISVFADLGNSTLSTPGTNQGPRMLLFRGDVLFVSVTGEGKVLALQDRDNDKRADSISVFAQGLGRPHGLDFSNGWLYIAEESRVVRVKQKEGELAADPASLQVLVDGLPSGAGHFTRTVKVKNGSMYISIGSSCNACDEKDERRAAILKCNDDGTDCSVFAKGLRNSVGIALHPETGKLYATENGRDFLGDDLPPDEINLIEEGNDYGWPMCYGKNRRDMDFDGRLYEIDPCTTYKTASLVDLQAHSAPLGLAFYNGTSFPPEYQGTLFVAFHGSWNRRAPTGYKLVAVNISNSSVKDFATGWLRESSVLGRPVDVAVAPDGSLFVSDDAAWKIYRISYAG